jgi:hypothetical protein
MPKDQRKPGSAKDCARDTISDVMARGAHDADFYRCTLEQVTELLAGLDRDGDTAETSLKHLLRDPGVGQSALARKIAKGPPVFRLRVPKLLEAHWTAWSHGGRRCGRPAT